jgi:membrane-bound serine protease (ClpP class)
MNAILILFLVGILLLAAEVFMPGAILGIIGGLSMAAGCVVAFDQFGVAGGLVATAVAALLLGLMLVVEFVLLPRTRLGRKMFVQSTVAAKSQPEVAPDGSIGREATALTTLAPSGYVSVDGHRYEAFCASGHAPVGTVLKVTGRDTFRLIVTKV